MNKLENNKLIAEFMGLNVVTLNEIRNNKNPHISSADGYTSDDIHYHDSWDWLMPVALKIVEKHGWDCISKRDSLNKVYQAVLEFIKANKKENKYTFEVKKWLTYEVDAKNGDDALKELCENLDLIPADEGFEEDAFINARLISTEIKKEK